MTQVAPDQAGSEIRSAAALHAALTAADAAMRLAALSAVTLQPAAALAFGLHADRDVIDVLLDQVLPTAATSARAQAEWLALVNALAAFPDSRVAAFFTALLAAHPDPTILFLAADYLITTRAEVPPATLTELLLNNDCPARARAAAPLLAAAGVACAAEQVRVALLVEDEIPPPPFAGAQQAWLAELRGPFVHEARAALEAEGRTAIDGLLNEWACLDEDTRVWLIDWVTPLIPALTAELVRRALDSGSERVIRAALTRAAERPRGVVGPAYPAVAQLLNHADPDIRRAAVLLATAPGVDWQDVLTTECDPLVRAAAARRLFQDLGRRALPALVTLLDDEAWQVRAAAADSLVGLADAVAPAVRPLVDDRCLTTRVAAVDILLRLGDDDWLAEHLLM